MIDFETASARLSYDPSSGLLTSLKAGRPVGNVRTDGYVGIRVCGKIYLAHRLAWLLMTGSWPKGWLDHKNLVRSDNRWRNLREATPAQNKANTRARSDNKLGVKGVSPAKGRKGRPMKANPYKAQIMRDGKVVSLGRFPTVESAAYAYKIAAEKTYGDFARIA